MDAALVLHGPGPWRGLLFCTSWVELCPVPLLQAFIAGGRDRHLAMTAADLAAEQHARTCSAVLPGWSRLNLCEDRAALHVVHTLGAEVAADLDGGRGLLVQFSFPDIARALHSEGSALGTLLHELLGPKAFFARPASVVSMSACVAVEAARSHEIGDDRAKHVLLSRIHARTQFALWDDMEDMLGLQRCHLALMRERLLELGECPEAPMSMAYSFAPWDSRAFSSASCDSGGGDGACGASATRPTLADLSQENRSLFRAIDQLVQRRFSMDEQRNAQLVIDSAIEPQLEMLNADAAFSNMELELRFAINLCMNRQSVARNDMSKLENKLRDLESGFDKSRRIFTRRERNLSKQIAATEEELAALSTSLANKREASRAAADAVIDARLVLAEAMVVAPTGLGDFQKLEQQLAAEGQALKQRVEELQRRCAKAKAAAKKR